MTATLLARSAMYERSISSVVEPQASATRFVSSGQRARQKKKHGMCIRLCRRRGKVTVALNMMKLIELGG